MNYLRRFIRLISKLARAIIQLFTGKTVKELEAAPAKPKKSRLERWLERHPLRKLLSTSRGGVNMPVFQPCPLGHGGKKRREKGSGGALYWCNKCQANFFVTHP